MGQNAENSGSMDQPMATTPSQPSEEVFSGAFTHEVCADAFTSLFCSPLVSFQLLGDSAYKSFSFSHSCPMKISLFPRIDSGHLVLIAHVVTAAIISLI